MTPGTEPSFSGIKESGVSRLGRFVREGLAESASEAASLAPSKLMYKPIKKIVSNLKKKPRMADKPPKISLRKAYED